MPAGGGAEIGLVVRIDRTPENQFQYRVTKNSFKETRYVGALGGNRKVSRKDVRPSCAAVVILNGACGLRFWARLYADLTGVFLRPCVWSTVG